MTEVEGGCQRSLNFDPPASSNFDEPLQRGHRPSIFGSGSHPQTTLARTRCRPCATDANRGWPDMEKAARGAPYGLGGQDGQQSRERRATRGNRAAHPTIQSGELTNLLALCISIGAVDLGNGAVPRGPRPRRESAPLTVAVNMGRDLAYHEGPVKSVGRCEHRLDLARFPRSPLLTMTVMVRAPARSAWAA